MRDATIASLIALMARLHLTNTDVGVLAGVSHATVRETLSRRELPVRAHARDAIERFVRVNRDAQRRVDLRVCGG